MIRILLVDDHILVREALRVVLELNGGMQVIAEADDGETALRMAEELVPDVVVMDVALLGISGIETTRRMLTKQPNIKVLALSTHLDRGIIQQMIDAGACGYIVKAAAGVELKRGIRSVMEGRFYLCPEVTALLVANTLRGRSSPSAEKSGNQSLTFRERQVVTLLAGGKSAPELADLLHISSRTVDVHRRNILKKLDLHNVVDLTKYAIRTGLILL
ncbi:MAG: response regulator transcription factor [Sterolibacterium sp.]|nr:response regulator transcription factor [Sterolibacterium sp.]